MNTPLVIGIGIVAVIVGIVLIVSLNTQVDSAEPQNIGLSGDVTIGTLLPLTGDLSLQGEERRVATQLAESDFNDYLKENNANWNLKIVYEDSAANPVMALEKLTSLYAKNIRVISGPSTSGEIRNIMGYANSNGMLLFSPSSTAPSLAIPNDSVYRLTPDDTKQGPALATLLEYHEINSVIQVVRADAWGDGLSATIEESFVMDNNVSQIIRYNPESPEFSVTTSLLAKSVNEQIAIYGTDKVGIVLIGFAETLQFMQSAANHEILNDVMWFGTDGSAKEESIVMDPIAVEFANKVQFTSTLLSTSNNEIHKDVEERIEKQLGRTPNTYAFSVYDIVWILGLAMYEADSSDVDTLTPIIHDIAAQYNGAIGNTKLNEAGDLDASNYDVWAIQNGEWIKIGYYNSESDSFVEISQSNAVDLKNNIKDIVQRTVDQYDGDLSTVTNLQFDEYYSFVLSGNMDEILVHPNSAVIGTYPVGINNANIPVDTILETLKTKDGMWVDYVYPNPATGNEESKRSWLTMSNGYIFASGYYNPSDMKESK